MVLFNLTIYIVFIFADDLPWSMVLCGLAAQVCYFMILKDFPFFTLSSLQFICASVLLVVNHYLAVAYFMQYDVDRSQVWFHAFKITIKSILQSNPKQTKKSLSTIITFDVCGLKNRCWATLRSVYGLCHLDLSFR